MRVPQSTSKKKSMLKLCALMILLCVVNDTNLEAICLLFLYLTPPKIGSTSRLARPPALGQAPDPLAFLISQRVDSGTVWVHTTFSSHHTTPMNFSALNFDYHTLPGATQAVHTFDNGWGISVLTAPAGSGIHGDRDCDTFEVAIYRPNGNMLEDVLYYQTPVQITSICHLLEML